jgi:hypothetical protein
MIKYHNKERADKILPACGKTGNITHNNNTGLFYAENLFVKKISRVSHLRTFWLQKYYFILILARKSDFLLIKRRKLIIKKISKSSPDVEFLAFFGKKTN